MSIFLVISTVNGMRACRKIFRLIKRLVLILAEFRQLPGPDISPSTKNQPERWESNSKKKFEKEAQNNCYLLNKELLHALFFQLITRLQEWSSSVLELQGKLMARVLQHCHHTAKAWSHSQPWPSSISDFPRDNGQFQPRNDMCQPNPANDFVPLHICLPKNVLHQRATYALTSM